MDKGPRLTICSVYHSPETKEFLELNWELVSRLNSATDWIWTVVDNTPNDNRITVDEKKLLSIKAFLTCVINEKETWAKQLLEMVLAFEKNLTLEEAVQWYQEKINQAPSHKHFF